MSSATICYLAQSEGKNDADSGCQNCAGKTLLTVKVDKGSWKETFYPAPYKFQGRTLATYEIDGVGPPLITGQLLDNILEKGPIKVYPVPVNSAGFSQLCLFYDAEGAPLINVAAIASGELVRPKVKGSNGSDANCPIESAKLGGKTYALENFVWSDKQVTKWGTPSGAWSATPGSGKGMMLLKAKQFLPTGNSSVACRFVIWEFNLLTPTKAGPQIGESGTFEFDSNLQAGLIAHYEFVDVEAKKDEPMTKPGEISIGDPGPKLFIVIGQQSVAYEIARLAEGAIRPLRNDIRSAAHGSVLKAPKIARGLRDKIARAARAATESQEELRELLLKLPPPKT